MKITDSFYKHYPTIQDAAMAIFFAVDHDEMIDLPVVEELLNQNPHLTISVEDLAKEAIHFSKQFYANKDRILARLNSNRSIRNLARQSQTNLPLSTISKTILTEINLILSNLCQMNGTDLFTKDNAETFIELIEDEDHLNHEFMAFLEKSLESTRINKHSTDEELIALDHKATLFASYLDHYLKELDDLQDIKQQLGN